MSSDLSLTKRGDELYLIIKKPIIESCFLQSFGFKQEGPDLWARGLLDFTLVEINTLLNRLHLPTWHPMFFQWVQFAQKELKTHYDISPLTLKLQEPLLPHQEDGVRFIINHHRCILADEMGLGKTATVIAAMIQLKTTKNLIVCPCILTDHWQTEILKFADSESILINQSEGADLKLALDRRFFIITYGLLEKLKDLLCTKKWDFVIINKHKETRLVQITGTPAQETYTMWNLLRLCNPLFFEHFYLKYSPKTQNAPKIMNPKQFLYADRYCKVEVIRIKGGSFMFAFKIPRRLDELNALTRGFILRREIDDVMYLPPIVNETIIIASFTKQQAKEYKMNI